MTKFVKVPAYVSYVQVKECHILPSAIIMTVPNEIDECNITLCSGRTFTIKMSEPQLIHMVEDALNDKN